LDTRVGSEFKEPFLAVTIGEVRVADLISTVPVLWSAVLATQELQPALMFDAEGALGLQGFQRLTVILGIRGRNTQMLRMSYGA